MTDRIVYKIIGDESTVTVEPIRMSAFEILTSDLEPCMLEGLDYRDLRLVLAVEKVKGPDNPIGADIMKYLRLLFLVVPRTLEITGPAYLLNMHGSMTEAIWNMAKEEIEAKKKKIAPPEAIAYIKAIEKKNEEYFATCSWIPRIVGGLFGLEMIKEQVARYGEEISS